MAGLGQRVTTALPRTNQERDQEAAAGTAALGGQLRLLDELTLSAISDLLSELRPEVVITTGHQRRVYTCDGYHNLRRDGGPLHLPVIVDVTSVWVGV